MGPRIGPRDVDSGCSGGGRGQHRGRRPAFAAPGDLSSVVDGTDRSRCGRAELPRARRRIGSSEAAHRAAGGDGAGGPNREALLDALDTVENMERELPSAGFSKLSKTEKDAVRERLTQLYAQLGVPAPVSGRSPRPQLGLLAS